MGSIRDVVIKTFNLHNSSDRKIELGLTQPETEMITRSISFGKGVRCVGLMTLPPSYVDCLEIRNTQPPRNLWACPGL